MYVPALRTVADVHAVDEIDRYLDALWAENPAVPAIVRSHMGIAVCEIAANIIKHATRGLGRPVTITMSAVVRSNDVVVTFVDDGIPSSDDLPLREMPHELEESGRGIPLARTALSRLEYRRSDGTNLWTLVSERF